MKTPLESTGPVALIEAAPAVDRAAVQTVPAADATAMSLVALLVFCVVCMAWGATILGRRQRQLTGKTSGENGVAEEGAEEPRSQNAAKNKNRAPWEKDGDWWKG